MSSNRFGSTYYPLMMEKGLHQYYKTALIYMTAAHIYTTKLATSSQFGTSFILCLPFNNIVFAPSRPRTES